MMRVLIKCHRSNARELFFRSENNDKCRCTSNRFSFLLVMDAHTFARSFSRSHFAHWRVNWIPDPKIKICSNFTCAFPFRRKLTNEHDTHVSAYGSHIANFPIPIANDDSFPKWRTHMRAQKRNQKLDSVKRLIPLEKSLNNRFECQRLCRKKALGIQGNELRSQEEWRPCTHTQSQTHVRP